MSRNVTHALREGLQEILHRGVTVPVGDRPIREVRSYSFHLTHPGERVGAIAVSPPSIFADLVQTIGAISGRQDDRLVRHYRSSETTTRPLAFPSISLRDRDGIDPLKDVLLKLNHPEDGDRATAIALNSTTPILQGLIRDDRLHFNLFVDRADLSSSSLPSFHFTCSVLQGAIAAWTDTEIGECYYSIGSAFIEESKTESIRHNLTHFKTKTVYEFGLKPSQLTAEFSQLDRHLDRWFILEEKMRSGDLDLDGELLDFPDPFLSESLQLLYIYNRYRHGDGDRAIARRLETLPTTDLKIAAIDYFSQIFQGQDRWEKSLNFTAREREYFEYLWKPEPAVETYSFADIFNLLGILHYKKTLVYKNSWKKHGEALGVFAGISRKYDRLETMFTENVKPTADESILDTFADLAVYSTKYLTYLAEHYPEIFRGFLQPYEKAEPLETYWYNEGFDPMQQILIERYGRSPEIRSLETYRDCYERIKIAYQELENMFVNRDWRVGDPRKCSLAADLAMTSIHYLVLASHREPESMAQFAMAIENL
ncbi:hypothetical protein JJD41_23570 [Oxynema sp. CENA135]|uniref:hypothetical protein n=1 Tax=Oxynema sp. CENA135 TaxID=984206 RepID=UPI00190C5051|nr:hypothetical protein [Oxynema sp. CENA135]MBK4732823.1 hypothetical protein [Oxynema sp. CENA135]